VSGLVQFVPLDQMQQRKVVVLCNLKPRNLCTNQPLATAAAAAAAALLALTPQVEKQ
jgi:hypothetical protein